MSSELFDIAPTAYSAGVFLCPRSRITHYSLYRIRHKICYQEFRVIRRPVRKGSFDWSPQGKIPDYIQAMPVFFLRRSLYKLLFFLITEAPYYFNP